MFERTDAFATTFPRINLNDTLSIATTNGGQISLGTYNQNSGQQAVLIDNSSDTVVSVSTSVAKAFMVNYTITRSNTYRTGTIMVASDTSDSSNTLTWNDDYVENFNTGIALTVSQVTDTVSLDYTSSNTGTNGAISYSITYLV
jgi:hypothetical protein